MNENDPRTRRLTSDMRAFALEWPQATSRDFLVVCVAGVEHAIDLKLVAEIRHDVQVTPFFDAPRHISGATRVGEQQVPVIDLRIRLNGSTARPSGPGVLIVVRHRRVLVGLSVDAVRETLASGPCTLPGHSGVDEIAWATAGFAGCGSKRIPILDVRLLLADAQTRLFMALALH